MADNHAHLLNVKENTQIAQIKQFINGNVTKWGMTLNNEPGEILHILVIE